MQTALGVTVPGRHPSRSPLQGREPGKPERQPENYYGIRICHSPVKPWGLGTDKLQGRAISGGAKAWQAACPTAGEAAAEQFCQAAHTSNGNWEFSGSGFSLDLGLDHSTDLTKDIHSWISPRPWAVGQPRRIFFSVINPESPCSLLVTQG